MALPTTPVESLVLVQHEALEHLVGALRYRMKQPADASVAEYHWYSPMWAIEEAERVLKLPPDGRAAYRELALHLEIVDLAYRFADVLHWLCYGEPRVPGRPRDRLQDVYGWLARLEEITQQLKTAQG
jgi:hypothetical protein